ncbi:hypothetical protein [Vibrio sp. F13]|uniref:hypothetical protein n=1 Tax=Vibrio sp. F13 TaxID=2070777 RepID=UPI0010BD2DA0|nr:hypothetical protein [Vibrio sp. F13]TKF97194.1 hypothetical protein FCV76_22260 [Vibrio sp. F13]
MSSVFKAITVASILAFLFIMFIHNQYVVYGYGLVGLAAVSVLIFSLLDQKLAHQRQLEQQQAFFAYKSEFQSTTKNMRTEICMAVKDKTEQDKRIHQQLISVVKQLESHTMLVSEIIDDKLSDLTLKINTLNSQQSADSIEQQNQLAKKFTQTAEQLSKQLIQENKLGRQSLDHHLEQITKKLSPIFELTSQIEVQTKENGEFMREQGNIIEQGNKQLQSILSEHSRQFTKEVSEQFSELNEEFEDRVNDMADNNSRLLGDVRQVVKTAQKGQTRTLEELTAEIQIMIQSQKVTQAATAQTLQELIEFKEELTQLNQKDLQYLEAMLNG